MAVYPTLRTSPGSDPRPVDNIQIERASDGTARSRITSADKMEFPSIKHEGITSAERTTLEDFYAANRLVPFTYNDPSTTPPTAYTCLFAARPRYARQAGDYWDVTVSLVEA